MDQAVQHFRDHGWMRLPEAFAADTAGRMRDAVWDALERSGISRDAPESWTTERPSHLQGLKSDPVFAGIATPALHGALLQALDGRQFETPANWGAFFLAFPTGAPWNLPHKGWHIDAHYLSPLWPGGGVKIFALLGDVAPRGGGTLILSGSHRLVHDWFRRNPPRPGLRSADLRAQLLAHPYLRDLHAPGDADGRIQRFMGGPETWDGVPIQVIEQTGAAGDIMLLHPLLMHVASSNCGAEPRFLMSGGITTDGWGWGTQ